MTKTKLRLNILSSSVAAALALSAGPALAAALDVGTIHGRSAPTPTVSAMGTDATHANAADRNMTPGRNLATATHGKARYQVDFELAKGFRTGTDVHVGDLMGRSAAPTRQRAHWNLQFSTIGDDPES